MNEYLTETPFLNFNSPEVRDFADQFRAISSEREKAVEIYYRIRDKFIYDPYHLDLRPEALIASLILSKKRAWCVEKAILMASVLRAVEIPSRLGFGIVVNHIGVEKLVRYLRREEIVFHGYVEVYLENKWVKATPAFDPLVCRAAGVDPLEWDGKNDAMFQEFSKGKKFMEYVHFYGTFHDVPVKLMNEEMKKYYPHLFSDIYDSKEFSFFHI
ncbi:MAG: transglutaminase-like domain-containing protein [Brumimicrobium sp.]|nr:transglutaminase-like domain-containing protein [Brumimicrobium sp.]